MNVHFLRINAHKLWKRICCILCMFSVIFVFTSKIVYADVVTPITEDGCFIQNLMIAVGTLSPYSSANATPVTSGKYDLRSVGYITGDHGQSHGGTGMGTLTFYDANDEVIPLTMEYIGQGSTRYRSSYKFSLENFRFAYDLSSVYIVYSGRLYNSQGDSNAEASYWDFYAHDVVRNPYFTGSGTGSNLTEVENRKNGRAEESNAHEMCACCVKIKQGV